MLPVSCGKKMRRSWREREKIGREINRETSEVVGVGEMSGLRFERRRMTKNRRLEVKD